VLLHWSLISSIQPDIMFSQTLTLHPYNVLELAFAAVAGFGALLIWNLPRYRALTVFFIFQSVLMLLNNWEESRPIDTFWLVTPVFTLAKGPLLYLFIRSMVNERRLSRLRLYLHFLPMLLALPLTIDPQFVIAFGTLSQLIYLALSFRLLRRYHRAARQFRADADALELGWGGDGVRSVHGTGADRPGAAKSSATSFSIGGSCLVHF
jgi:hypothetical protein